jgi:putative tricarboxylic transport membrane protein
MIGTIGIDVNSGQSRFTGGIFNLYEGIDFAVAAIGLFAISEVLYAVTEPQMMSGRKPYKKLRELIPTRTDFGHALPTMARSSVLGFVAGVLPGAGATLASFLAYGTEKKVAKRRKLFGTGVIEGVAAPESANNAATGGSMVPMLTLGIPGSAVTALLLSALVAQGIQPGPLTFVEQPALVWGLIASMYIGNLMLLFINLPFVGVWIQLLRLPGSFLYTMVGALAVIGAYSVRFQMFDVWVMLGFGLLGYAMRRLDFPLAPMILALVLGPLLESNVRRALTISRGDPMIFLSSGISIGLLIGGFAFMMLPIVIKALSRKDDHGLVEDASHTSRDM